MNETYWTESLMHEQDSITASRRIQLQPHTNIDNILVYWLERLTVKQATKVQSLVKSLDFLTIFHLVEFILIDDNYEKQLGKIFISSTPPKFYVS